MEIRFENKKATYIVTEINYGDYKGGKAAYVRGHYLYTNRIMPTKLFKDKKTGRPCLSLSGKMFAVNIKDDKLFSKEILDLANEK